MRGKSAQDPPDRRISRLAARQHGVVERGQLLALGFGPGAIDERIRGGRLHRIHRGVYAVGYRPLSREAGFIAAVLACGRGAVLSHGSAGVLWGLLRGGAARIHVTLPTRAGRRERRGIVVHRSVLAADEVTTRTHIRVTSPVRTLIDLADVLPRRAFERALDQAEYLRLDLVGLAPRHGRPGSGLLYRVLAGHSAGSTLTRSELEERFLALQRAGGLPRPDVNARVGRYEVDFLWRSERLIVEADGHAAHGTRAAFERDRIRDAELTASGYRVVRITHRRLVREPGVVREQLRRLLASSVRAARLGAEAGPG